MQGFFKDMKAICIVLNIGQPVIQIVTVLNCVSRVLKKNDMKFLLLVQKLYKKTVIHSLKETERISECLCVCVRACVRE